MSECDKIVHQYQGNDVFQWFLREGMSNSVLKNSCAGWVSITGVGGETDVRNRQGVFLNRSAAPGLQG